MYFFKYSTSSAVYRFPPYVDLRIRVGGVGDRAGGPFGGTRLLGLTGPVWVERVRLRPRGGWLGPGSTDEEADG